MASCVLVPIVDQSQLPREDIHFVAQEQILQTQGLILGSLKEGPMVLDVMLESKQQYSKGFICWAQASCSQGLGTLTWGAWAPPWAFSYSCPPNLPPLGTNMYFFINVGKQVKASHQGLDPSKGKT